MFLCDSFCGVGSFLVECAAQLLASTSNSVSFNGQEIDRDFETIYNITTYGIKFSIAEDY